VKLTEGFKGREPEIVALFTAAFTASEGPGAGRLIGGLVRDLLARTPPEDIRVVGAEEDGALVGAAIFTRLTYPEDDRAVVLLSPLAVAPDRQGHGIGQALLAHALDALRAEAPEPAAGLARAEPQGGPVPALRGPSRCVPALQRPELW